jgi:hypothetical protein
LATPAAAREEIVRTPLCTVRSTAPVFFLVAVRLRPELSEGDTDTPKPPELPDDGRGGQYPSLSLGPYLQGFLERDFLTFADARGFPRADPVALELVPLPLLERDPDRPELLARDLDFPAVGPVERCAACRVPAALRGELLRREVERLEVLEAAFFFWPYDGAATSVVASPSTPE